MDDDIGELKGPRLWEAFNVVGRLRRAEHVAFIISQQGCRVASGPFSGMILPRETSWGEGGDLCPKLLGSYESELHPAIAKAIARAPVAVVNVGCAEGYYAVGLARALPRAQVIAFDVDQKARSLCRQAAAVNSVASRLRIEDTCNVENLRSAIGRQGLTLVVMDCEGAEFHLLNPAIVPELRDCDIIVECHDFNETGTSSLRHCLAPTHVVENIREGARDPNQFPLLQKMRSLDRWLAMDESRPATMNWLVCWTRTMPAGAAGEPTENRQ
jgi:predicted O-methyltransferase YrrM